MVYGVKLPSSAAVRSSRRDAEIHAVRTLVAETFGYEAVLAHDKYGAPYIEGQEVNISISHGAGYALLAVNRNRQIGIDIESHRPALIITAPRFMSAGELKIYGKSPSMILRAWTAKEALFKAAGNPTLTVSEIHLPDLGVSDQVRLGNGCYRMTFIENRNFTIALAEKI